MTKQIYDVDIYYTDYIKMNSEGISDVVFMGDEVSVDEFFEYLLDDINDNFPEYGGEFSLYINADMCGYDILVDSSNLDLIDKINDYLYENWSFNFIES